jgi:hypothetical protein
MNALETKRDDVKPFFICRLKSNGQYLWIAFEVWEDKQSIHEAYKFTSVHQIVDFFEWQGQDLSKYEIVKVEYLLNKVDEPYLKDVPRSRKKIA